MAIKLPGAPDLDAACVAAHGRSWTDLKAPLTPHYGRVWADIAFCYGGLLLGTGGVALVQATLGVLPALLLLPLGVLWTGFWMSSLIRFMHEGDHHLLHPDRAWNDRLCNSFVCAWVLDEVQNNRRVHWQHHLHLGGHGDTEVSYFRAPTTGFLIETFTGLYVFRVIARRILGLQDATGRQVQAGPKRSPARIAFVIARSVLYHVVVVGLLLATGLWVGALAWVLAMGSAYPFFDVLRQVLEHRRTDLGPDVDLRVEVHGPHNRLFGKDALSRWFGNAGFHNHLLHHWDPTVSYTRLDEMEALLMQTELAEQIASSRTTYWRTYKALRAAATR